MGHAITASRPLSYRRTPIGAFDAYRVNGTPADCVALGAHQWDKVNVILSGCNLGFNLGNGIWHSGTLAAAKQAVLLGLRGIAFSAAAGIERFDALKPWMHRALDTLLPLKDLPLVNVNPPPAHRAGSSGRASRCDNTTARSCRCSTRWAAPCTGSRTPLRRREEGTDRWAVEQRLDLDDAAARRPDRRTPPRAVHGAAPDGRGDCLRLFLNLHSSPEAAKAVKSGRGFSGPGGWTTLAGCPYLQVTTGRAL